MKPRVPVTIEARLGYRNKGDAPDDWKEYASSTEVRTMDCSPPEVRSSIFIFEANYDLCFFCVCAEGWLPLQLFTSATF